MTSVAFNPRVLEEFGRNCRNMTDADTLVQLALDYVENEQKVKLTRTYTILPVNTTYKGDLKLVRLCFTKAFQKNMKGKANGDMEGFSKDMEEMEKTFGPLSSKEKESLLSQLSNISMSSSTSPSSGEGLGPNSGSQTTSDSVSQSSIRIPGMSGSNVQSGMSKGVNGIDFKSRKAHLIQEISEDRLSSVPPKYTLESEGSNLVLKVELPGVKSVSECDLDISEVSPRDLLSTASQWGCSFN